MTSVGSKAGKAPVKSAEGWAKLNDRRAELGVSAVRGYGRTNYLPKVGKRG